MAGYANIDGTWQELKPLYATIDGVQTPLQKGYANVDGVWCPLFTSEVAFNDFSDPSQISTGVYDTNNSTPTYYSQTVVPSYAQMTARKATNGRSASNGYFWVRTQNKIDVTPFKSLIIPTRMQQNGEVDTGRNFDMMEMTVGICSNFSVVGYIYQWVLKETNRYEKFTIENQRVFDKTYEIDISGISGEYYLAAQAYQELFPASVGDPSGRDTQVFTIYAPILLK